MVAGQTQAGGATYYYSGDWTNTVAVTGSYGWVGGTGPGGLPGAADTVGRRLGDLAGSRVTLSTVAPLITSFRFGYDESWYMIVNAGGVLTTSGSGGVSSSVGHIGTACIGRMTVSTGGQVIVTNVLFVGNGTHGFVTNDGGNMLITSHLWVGAQNNINGLVRITNGGVVNVGGNIGLGTVNASTPSGGTGKLYVQDGGILNLTTISATNSIQPNSLLDISGSGQVIVPGDRAAVMSYYTNVGRITAYGGAGTVAIDYNTSNPGKTTLKAVGGYVPPAECVWTQTNTSSTGLWSDAANWTCGPRPAGVTTVIFNVPGAIPCTVNASATADCIVMGTNGPGGTLIITNTGSLACGGTNATFIGYNSNALMVVANGASASFSAQLHIGFDAGSDGTLIMNGGAVSVAGLFDLGYQGGKGTAQIKGGTLNLSQLDDSMFIQGASVLDLPGTGKVVINGDHQLAMNYYISTGQITNSSGAGLGVDYNLINVGKTTVYPSDLVLPPTRVVWNPAANPSSTGLWNECANWTGGLCPGDVTVVTFNVLDAIPCTVTNAAIAGYVSMGDSGGPGGTLIITNGGSLTTGSGDSSAVGCSSKALMIVENGASASFGYHLWVGFNPTGDGTLIIDGGTVEVWGMFGVGWNGGKGIVIITNGGKLILHQWHPTDSIKGASVLNLTGTGTVVITGNQLTPIANYVSSGKIIANGGAGTVAYGFDSAANKTIIQVASPRQSVTSATVRGGNVTLTYQTTAGLFYHIESTPSLSPALWTPVAGSITNATGASVTFMFPTRGDQTFYRTVSP